MEVLGVDIGGSGIKGNIVDTLSGKVLDERFKILTPKPSDPAAVIGVIKEIIAHFDWESKPLGFGFPAIIKHGKCLSASNIDKSWLNYEIEAQFKSQIHPSLVVLNDADAAGLAEYYFGNARNIMGTVLVLTLGTGIGSALFYNGVLIPNTEFGHLLYKDSIFERFASSSAKKRKKLSYAKWAEFLKIYLAHLTKLFSPERIIIGGGISRKFHRYKEYIKDIPVEVIPAAMENEAGIIGAAKAFQLSLTEHEA
jgi:polyphosphate glucokinase